MVPSAGILFIRGSRLRQQRGMRHSHWCSPCRGRTESDHADLHQPGRNKSACPRGAVRHCPGHGYQDRPLERTPLRCVPIIRLGLWPDLASPSRRLDLCGSRHGRSECPGDAQVTEAEHDSVLGFYYRGTAIGLTPAMLREIEEAGIKFMPQQAAIFDDGYEATLKSFTCGLVFPCAADKIASGHAVSPQPTSHGRNLSAFLFHHAQMATMGALDLSSPSYQESLTREMASANPNDLASMTGVTAPVPKAETQRPEGSNWAKALANTWSARATELNAKNVNKATGIARAGETDEAQTTSRRALLHGADYMTAAIISYPTCNPHSLRLRHAPGDGLQSSEFARAHRSTILLNYHRTWGGPVPSIPCARSSCPETWKQLLEAEEQAALSKLSSSLERYGLALGDSGHFFTDRVNHPLAQQALRDEVKGAGLARGLRKIVDLFESFSPTASILGSLSLRALTDQSPADEGIVNAAKAQAKASASRVAIAASVRASLYPSATSAIDPIVEFAAASATADGKLDLGKPQAVAQAITSLVASMLSGVTASQERIEALEHGCGGARQGRLGDAGPAASRASPHGLTSFLPDPGFPTSPIGRPRPFCSCTFSTRCLLGLMGWRVASPPTTRAGSCRAAYRHPLYRCCLRDNVPPRSSRVRGTSRCPRLDRATSLGHPSLWSPRPAAPRRSRARPLSARLATTRSAPSFIPHTERAKWCLPSRKLSKLSSAPSRGPTLQHGSLPSRRIPGWPCRPKKCRWPCDAASASPCP